MARNPELEAVLLANPSDRESYRVYADWLEAQGDPRGELIALELRSEDAPSDGKLRALIEGYMARNKPALLGDLAFHLERGIGHWRRGFIDSLQIDRRQFPDQLAPLLALMLQHPSSALLASLTVIDGASAGPVVDVLEAIGAHGQQVRYLKLGYGRDLDALTPLYAMPNILRLSIAYEPASIFDRPRPVCALSGATLRSIAAAPWPLHDLALDLEGSPASADDLAPLFRRTDLPLVSLSIRKPPGDRRRPSLASELCRMLVASPLAARLEKLHLGVGDLTRADYKLLVDNRTRFRKLRDVSLPSRTFSARLTER